MKVFLICIRQNNKKNVTSDASIGPFEMKGKFYELKIMRNDNFF